MGEAEVFVNVLPGNDVNKDPCSCALKDLRAIVKKLTAVLSVKNQQLFIDRAPEGDAGQACDVVKNLQD